ncbi:MAG: hydroxysqualene dehydroxylase HpnE [Burkholderiales bacterium]|jgi:squalene-associated FAD-dependent desaturase|nr:hydroxysqualene dehydroxylase HpnE [Burkholderiales bacterium]
MKRVAIIGAGWAGLAAAVTLSQGGIAPQLFEAARQLGGRARRVEVEGLALDNGQHILIGAYRETLRLMRGVGVDTDRALLRLPLELRLAGGFRMRAPPWPPPLHLAGALAGARGLTLGEKWAALRFVHHLRRSQYRLDVDMPVVDLLVRHRQPEAVRARLWEPLCVAALNTPSNAASAQVFANVLRDTFEGDRAASDLLLPRSDLGALFPDAAAEYVRRRGGIVSCGAAVRSLAWDAAHRWTVDAADPFDAVIVACAPAHAATLLGALAPLAPLAAEIGALEFEPIYTCYMQYPESIALPFPMMGFESGSVHWVFDRGALSGQAGLIAAVTSASGAHEDEDRAAFTRVAHEALATLVPGLPQPRWSRVIAERRATFACTPNLRRPANETAMPGLFLAGDYTASDYPGTLESAVRSGIAAAHLAAEACAGG